MKQPFNFKRPMRLGLTVCIMAAGLYVILVDGFPEATNQWAFGVVGFILGYWFKEQGK